MKNCLRTVNEGDLHIMLAWLHSEVTLLLFRTYHWHSILTFWHTFVLKEWECRNHYCVPPPPPPKKSPDFPHMQTDYIN